MTTEQLTIRREVIWSYMDHLEDKYLSHIHDTDAVDVLLHALSVYQLDLTNRIAGFATTKAMVPVLRAGMQSAESLLYAIEDMNLQGSASARYKHFKGFIGQTFGVCQSIVRELAARTSLPPHERHPGGASLDSELQAFLSFPTLPLTYTIH